MPTDEELAATAALETATPGLSGLSAFFNTLGKKANAIGRIVTSGRLSETNLSRTIGSATATAKRVNAYRGNPALAVANVVMDTPPTITITEAATSPRAAEAFLVSDGFSGSGELSGRNADNALGGSSTLAWAGTASRVTISSGKLIQNGASSAVLGIAMPQADYHVSVVIDALPTGDNITLVGRRTVLSGGTHVGLVVAPSGAVTGTGITLPTTTITAGTRIGLRFSGDQVEALVNGTVIATATTSLLGAGFAGISRAGSTVFSLDDFWVKTPTYRALSHTTTSVTKRRGRYSAQTVGGATYQQNYINNPSTSRSQGEVEFDFTGDAFDVKFYNAIPGTTGLRVWVNGQLVADAPTTTAGGSTAAAVMWGTVAFATSATRRLRIEFVGGALFGGLTVDLLDTVVPLPTRLPKCAVFGDSWVGGAGSIPDRQLLYTILGLDLGWETARLGQGGSGYDQVGSGSGVEYGDASRIAELVAYAPDFIVIIGSINDNGHTASTVGTKAAALYAALATQLPQAKLYVVGPQFADWSTPATTIANRDAIKAAALAAPNVVAFIDPIADAWLTTGNRETYMLNESGSYAHLNEAGHAWYTHKIATEILRVGPSPALPWEA